MDCERDHARVSSCPFPSRHSGIAPESQSLLKMKRYCQTLDLRNDPQFIDQYVAADARVWPEIQAGIREVGILDTLIYWLEKPSVHDHGHRQRLRFRRRQRLPGYSPPSGRMGGLRCRFPRL